jgi:hypothetical protein
VNWAKAVALTTKEKVQREEAKLMKSGFSYLFKRGGGKGSNKFECKFCKSKPSEVDVLESDVIMCPYGVSAISVTRV